MKKMKTILTKNSVMASTLVAIGMTVLTACGPNAFKQMEKQEPAQEATVALENDNAQKAIDILTDALKDDPGNQQYISILALAYAQRAGVDPLTLAQKMASDTANSDSSLTLAGGNSVTALFGVMPVATEATIADVDTAVALLLSLTTRPSYDVLKLAMFQTASMTLRAKILDTNGDGILSPAELLTMTSTSAIAILSQLAGAADAFSGSSSSSTTDQAASARVSTIQAAIAAEQGATDEERLKNYLARTGS
jgi:hypothetical protein